MPISPVELRNVITREDDFGHEIRVGHAIRSCPTITMQHGGTYTDSITQKPRQFDYRCCLVKEQTSLLLAVECKNLSPTQPLVVCGAARRDEEAFHDLIESTQGTIERRSTIIHGLGSLTRRAGAEHAFYPPKQFVGKSLMRVKADKPPMQSQPDSDIYDKWAQALSSAIQPAESACKLAKKFAVARILSAVLPAVVVPDRVLWRAAYGDNGSLLTDPEQVEECELFVGREIEVRGPKGTPFFQRFTFSHVHFFTLTGFGAFLSRMVVNEESWTRLFTDKSVEISAA